MNENQFDQYLHQTQEYGIVKEIQHPIVYCSGLPNARIHEQVVFEDGQVGQVLSIKEDQVELVVFTRTPVNPGIRVARTGNYMTIPVGHELLGAVINPISELIFDKNDYRIPKEQRNFENATPMLYLRKRIERQMETGIGIVDTMIPLGKGQRELIVGDRKTGKTSAIINMIIRQVQLGSIVVYAVIGKNKSEIKRVKTEFEDVGVLQNSVIVATSSDDSPSLIDLCPYSAMTIAEYFKDAGKDVLVVFDDLSTHAKFYRELQLLGNTFPGRDSYPGDIFYKHARLLERAGNYYSDKAEIGEVAITALPMAETTDGRMNDYIVSNLISITDGHLLFDVQAFNKGRRPAIDIFLSVTRVGKQTQTDVTRKLNRKLFQMMSKYIDAENFQHFGAELNDEVKALLKRGDLIYKLFEQPYTLTVPIPLQAIMIEMIMKGLLDEYSVDTILDARSKLFNAYVQNQDSFNKMNDIFNQKSYDDFEKRVESESNSIKEICKT